MKRNILKSIALLCILAMISCTERIDIHTETNESYPVIYGILTTDTCAHKVTFSKTLPYFSQEETPYIVGARGYIESSSGELFHLTESANEIGCYYTDNNVYGEIGKTYTLHMFYDFNSDNVEEEYTATDFIRPTPQIDSINFSHFVVFSERIQPCISFQSGSDEAYYLAPMAYNEQLVTDSLSQFITFSNEGQRGKYITKYPVYIQDNEDDHIKLLENDTVKITLCTISKAYHQFITQSQKEIAGGNPIFSTPPANVGTNFKGGAKGIFVTYALNKHQTLYKRNE